MQTARNLALNIIANSPQVANNPNAQSLISVIQSGDSARGEQIARNLCNSYGVTEQQALEQAKRFFNIH